MNHCLQWSMVRFIHYTVESYWESEPCSHIFLNNILASADVGSKSEVMLRHSGDSSNSSYNVDQILTNFDHLPPLSGQLGTFYILPILCSRHLSQTFYWPPTLSCSRTYWMTPQQQRRPQVGLILDWVRSPRKKTFLLDFEGLSFHTLDSGEEPALFDLITSKATC